MSDQVFWFATRSAGILAWFAASTSLLIGLTMSTRALGRRPTIPWLLDLHRFFAAMSMVFLAIHLVTLWADSFVTLGPVDLLVPGVATIPGLSRLSLFLGVTAGWLLAIVQGSSLIKDHLPPRHWHTIHLTSFGVVISGAVHAVQAGSDTDNRYLIAAAASIGAAMAILTVIRALAVLFERKRRYDETIDDVEWDDELDDEPDDDYEDEPDDDYELVPLTASARLVDPGKYPEPSYEFEYDPAFGYRNDPDPRT